MSYRRLIFHALMTVALASGMFLPASTTIHAAPIEYVVTKAADTADGSCNADCSLREAIIAANANPGRDTIQLPAGLYLLTLVGPGEDAAATGDLDITDDLTLRGLRAADVLIDGNSYNNGNFDRVIEIRGKVSVELAQVTIQRGFVRDDATAGIRNSSGSLRLVDCVIRDNSQTFGGSVSNGGQLTALRTTFRDNEGSTGVGAISNGGDLQLEKSSIIHNNGTAGGAISNGGIVTLTESLVQNNTGTDGGVGAFVNSGSMTFISSTLTGNSGEFDGMMLNYGSATFRNSLIYGNGGFTIGAIRSYGDLTLINTTVTGNGGRLVLQTTRATIIQSTIAGNHPRGDGFALDGTATLKQTIIADNSPGGEFSASNCSPSGSFASEGYNIDDDGTCRLNKSGDLSAVEPKLGLLGDHGGPTLTYALLAGSPAYNAIPSALCATGVDQRGITRPKDGACDIGAFEADAINKAKITIYKAAQPKSTQDFTFYGPLGKFWLDDALPDDGDSVSAVTSFLVNSGSHNLTESVLQSWYLAGITCSGNGQSTPSVAQRSVNVTVMGGEEMNCTFANQRRVNLQAIKFNDLNGDGLRQSGEPTLASWEIHFYKGDGALLSRKVTDANGFASINNLVAGSFKVCETPQAGWTNTLPGQIDPLLGIPCYTITLKPGQNGALFFGNSRAMVTRPAEEIDPSQGVSIRELPDVNEAENDEPESDANIEQEGVFTHTLFLPVVSR